MLLEALWLERMRSCLQDKIEELQAQLSSLNVEAEKLAARNAAWEGELQVSKPLQAYIVEFHFAGTFIASAACPDRLRF